MHNQQEHFTSSLPPLTSLAYKYSIFSSSAFLLVSRNRSHDSAKLDACANLGDQFIRNRWFVVRLGRLLVRMQGSEYANCVERKAGHSEL